MLLCPRMSFGELISQSIDEAFRVKKKTERQIQKELFYKTKKHTALEFNNSP